MTEVSPIASVLDQLQQARAGVDERIEQLAGELGTLGAERDRMTAAIAALDGDFGQSEPQKPAQTKAAAKPTAARRAAPKPGKARVQGGVTPGIVLAWMKDNADGWTSMGPSVAEPVFRVSAKTLGIRLAVLVAEGKVEHNGGKSAASKYRLKQEDDRPVITVEPDDDQAPDDETSARSPVEMSARTRRAVESEQSEPESLRPEGSALRQKIVAMLSQGRARTADDIARSLVVNVAEVRTEIQEMFQLRSHGDGPRIVRHASGSFYIEAEAA